MTSPTLSYAEVASKGPKQSPEEAAAPQPPQVNPVLSASVAASTASTGSLIDVDTPSVHTVPPDYPEQPIKTTTQAARVELEAELREQQKQQEREAEQRKAKEKEQQAKRREGEEEDGEEAGAETNAAGKPKKSKKTDKKHAAEKGTTKEPSKPTSAARRLDAWLAHHLLDPVVHRTGSQGGPGGGRGGGEYAPATGAIALANAAAVVALSGWLGFRAWGLYDRGRLGWRKAGLGLGVLGAMGAVEGVLLKWVLGPRFASSPSRG